jgi:photosystem II stability/assembly factor-like uncharacterized protein
MRPILRFILLIIPLFLLSYGCKKKVIEIVPVIEYEDISIPDNADLKFFSFPTLNVGYAGVNKLFKTTDGGKSWNTLNLPGTITGLEFVDESTGFCVSSNLLYKTKNGGSSWNYLMPANYIGKSENGNIVVGTPGNFTCKVQMSKDTGTTFFPLRSISVDGNILSMRVLNNKVFVFGSESYFSDAVNGLNLIDTSKFVKIGIKATAYENPNDAYFSGSDGAAVGMQGYIGYSSYNLNPDIYLANFSRIYYDHTYTYNSVDGFDGLMVAVGYHTIASNIDIDNEEKWNEVFDKQRNGFEQTFYKVRFFDKQTLFISGNNGLLWKAKI